MDLTYIENARKLPHNERIKNRNLFLDSVTNSLPINGKMYVLISPSYDLMETAPDLGNSLKSRFDIDNVKVSRSPRIHSETLQSDLDHLCSEASSSNLIVYLAYHLCDHYIHDLPSGGHRYGHHIVEAAALAKRLGKNLVVGYLDDCGHSHNGSEDHLAHVEVNFKLFNVGGSFKRD